MFVFKPLEFLKLIFPKNFWKKKLLTNNIDVKKTAVQAMQKASGLSKRELNPTLNKVVDIYTEKFNNLKQSQDTQEALKDTIRDNALIKQRVENLIVYNEVQEIKTEYKDKYYKWLPSTAKEQDPEHALLYGKTFKVGTGDKNGNMPGERYGCKCGIKILD